MDRTDLSKYKTETGYNLAQLEVDYFQHYILKVLFEKYATLYFKGGTCLQKCYNIKRFSADLDFNYVDININEMLDFLKTRLNYPLEVKEIHNTQFGYTITLAIQGILYDGSPNSVCKIVLDLRNKDIFLKPMKRLIRPIYSDILNYFLLALSKEEILAEKVRAIITRFRARDIFDINELLTQGVKINIPLINKKLESYEITFNKKEFLKKVEEKRTIYDSEMRTLVKVYPSFAQCVERIRNSFKK